MSGGGDTFDWVLSFPNSPQDDDVKVCFNAQLSVPASHFVVDEEGGRGQRNQSLPVNHIKASG
jgi:hypothetical protein